MTYKGWNDYMLAAGLAQSNPVLREQFENEDVEFNPLQSFVGGMNTPQLAQSKFIHQIRRPAHSDITFVRLANNGYSYPLTEQQLGQWMCSQSLGKYYNQYLKRG